jgi:cephalosporin-C deacetylase-like acetyl esterase
MLQVRKYAMRYPIALIAAVLTASGGYAQDPARVPPADSEPRQMLYTYLQTEAKKHFDARRLVVANLKTPEEIHKRQEFLQRKFLEALGGFPDKTPLNAKAVGTLQGDGFRVEKVIYESRPNHHVTANLYVPAFKGRVPGVLLPCGHSDNGKAAEAYQRACILMAQNGMAVLCYDPIGQGERNQLLDQGGKPAITGTSEHTMIGVGALLVGQSTATYRIWDGMRSLDYLESRPEIDPQRLGCTGNSGGGTMTAYLMALDDRIAAAAPSCYLTTLEKLFATIGPQDAEQNITGQVAFGMEHADYLTMRAPRPTLMAVATHDYFNIEGAWTTFREASLIYGKLGLGERVALFEFEDKHGFSRPRREAAMRWLRRWLVGKDDARTEGDFKVFSDAELQCTRSGQVLTDFKGTSAFQMNAETARELAGARAKHWHESKPETLSQEIRYFLSYPNSKIQLPPNYQGREGAWVKLTPFASFIRQTTNFATEPGIDIPIGFFYPREIEGKNPSLKLQAGLQAPFSGEGRRKLTIYLHGDGYDMEADPGFGIAKLVKAGHEVVAIDLRGMGISAAGKLPTKTSFFGNDSKEAFLALHVNRPLLGQRVYDLLCAVEFFAKRTDSIEVIAIGSAGPIALHAAALDSRISGLTLEKSLISWQNVVETPISFNQLANVVPGALRVYDLPDLASLIAPRPLTIRGAVDARGRPVALEEVISTYQGGREKYGQLKAENNFRVESIQK